MIERIAVNPDVLGGKPVIKGTRMAVEFILELLASDVSKPEAFSSGTNPKQISIRNSSCSLWRCWRCSPCLNRL